MNESVITSESDAAQASVDCPSQTAEAGRARVCDGCPGQEACARGDGGAAAADQKLIDVRMGAIAHKIMIVSGKGGVGKSSVTAMLAMSLATAGKRIGVLDVDICGPSMPRLLNCEDEEIVNTEYGWIPAKDPRHGIAVMSVQFMLQNRDDPLIWRGPRKTNMIRRFLKDTYWGRLDYLIVDTPPGTSDEHLSVLGALQSVTKTDGCVIVTTPQELSLQTVRRELTFCEKMDVPVLGIIENMSGYVCDCCGEISDVFGKSGGGENLAKEVSTAFLGKLPLDQRLSLAAENGQCLLCVHPDTSVAKKLMEITKNLQQVCGSLEEQW